MGTHFLGLERLGGQMVAVFREDELQGAVATPFRLSRKQIVTRIRNIEHFGLRADESRAALLALDRKVRNG